MTMKTASVHVRYEKTSLRPSETSASHMHDKEAVNIRFITGLKHRNLCLQYYSASTLSCPAIIWNMIPQASTARR